MTLSPAVFAGVRYKTDEPSRMAEIVIAAHSEIQLFSVLAEIAGFPLRAVHVPCARHARAGSRRPRTPPGTRGRGRALSFLAPSSTAVSASTFACARAATISPSADFTQE